MTCTPPTTPITSPLRTPTSTIVQLLYGTAPPITFPSLLGHLCETLCGTMGQNARLAVMNSDTAHLDMAHHRLTIALHHNVPGAAASCLTLAIGPNPHALYPDQTQELNDAQIIASQTAMASRLSDAVTCRLPADQILWHIAPQILTSAMLKDMLTQLPRILPGPSDVEDGVNLSRVMDQVQITLSGKSLRQPTVLPLQQIGGPGFSRRWPAGQMAMVGGAPRKRPRPAATSLNLMAAIAAPANDTPALPKPNHTGLLRAHTALHHGRSRPATRLILSAGQSSQRVVAFLSHAC